MAKKIKKEEEKVEVLTLELLNKKIIKLEKK